MGRSIGLGYVDGKYVGEPETVTKEEKKDKPAAKDEKKAKPANTEEKKDKPAEGGQDNDQTAEKAAGQGGQGNG